MTYRNEHRKNSSDGEARVGTMTIAVERRKKSSVTTIVGHVQFAYQSYILVLRSTSYVLGKRLVTCMVTRHYKTGSRTPQRLAIQILPPIEKRKL